MVIRLSNTLSVFRETIVLETGSWIPGSIYRIEASKMSTLGLRSLDTSFNRNLENPSLTQVPTG